MNTPELRREIDVTGIASAFRYTFPENFGYGGDRHSCWEFVYIESGRVSVIADDRKYILKSGEMVCHKPMEFHNIRPYHGEATAIIVCFYCDGDKISYFENRILTVGQRCRTYLNDIIVHSEKLFLPKHPLLIQKDGCMDRSEKGTAVDEQFMKNTMELLILSLYSVNYTDINDRSDNYLQYVQRKKLTENIICFLNDNLSGKVSISDISRKFSYSPSSVKTIFKKETGKSVIEYLNDLRIGRAGEMLASGRYRVSDVAETLGYSNVAYFSCAFKKKTGINPKNYIVKSKAAK